jgi:hypothetical protein
MIREPFEPEAVFLRSPPGANHGVMVRLVFSNPVPATKEIHVLRDLPVSRPMRKDIASVKIGF